MTAPIYRQILTLDHSRAARDIGALHKLVMAGYQHALDGQYDNARNLLGSLFLAQRPAPSFQHGQYPPVARSASKVLVQANTAGEWDPSSGVVASAPIAVDISLGDGDLVEVQTLVNPTHSLPPKLHGDGTFKRGKRVVMTNANEIANWFVRTIGERGLALEPHQVVVGSPERLRGVRDKAGSQSPLTFDVRLLRGTGTITDAQAFTQALANGIGRGRPYGAGLIRHRRVG